MVVEMVILKEAVGLVVVEQQMLLVRLVYLLLFLIIKLQF